MNSPEQQLQRLEEIAADVHARMRAILLMPDWEQQAEARYRQLVALDAYDKALETQQAGGEQG